MLILEIDVWGTCCVTGPDDVNIGSGNGLVLSGNKPLPKPMLIQIYYAIYGITRPQ